MFRPVLSQGDLPPEGTTREDFALDMKAKVDQTNQFELAKDMAAFANSSGGTVLVGAVEDRAKGTLTRYLPFPESEANAVVKAYSLAVTQRCFPAPFIDVKAISKDAGFVVAVNVWPFPAQVVGVKIRADRADGFGGEAYFFPLRSGVDTVTIRSEHLPMFMLPELRRLAIMLDSIPPNERGFVDLASPSGHKSVGLKEVNILTNSFTVEWARDPTSPIKFSLPLDIVQHIWKDANGRWRIAVRDYDLLPDGSTNV